jgi:hypothetical protein
VFKVSKWLLVTALTLSLGFHWAILQSAAWVGMVVKYSECCNFKEALQKTFDGKHPCKLCKLVKEGKQTEKKSEAKLDVKKLDFTASADSGFHFSILHLRSFGWLANASSRSEPPPLLPPRVSAASLS